MNKREKTASKQTFLYIMTETRKVDVHKRNALTHNLIKEKIDA